MPRIPRARVTTARPAGRLPRAPFDIADVGSDAQGLVDLGRGITTLADTVLDEIAKTELATASADLDKFDYEAEQQVRDAEITDSLDFDALLGGMQMGRKKVIEDISSKLGSRAKRQFGIVATKSEPYANARIARLVGQRRIPYQRGVYIEKHLDMLRRGADTQAGVWTDVNRKWFEPGEIEIQEAENIRQVQQENVYGEAMGMTLSEGIEHINKSITDPKSRRSLRELLKSDKAEENVQNDELRNAAKNEHMDAITKGDFSAERIIAINNDPRFKDFPDEKTKLIDWLEQRNRAVNSRKLENITSTDRIKAENEIYEAIEAKNEDKANSLLIKHGWMFTDSKNSSMLQDIRKQEEEGADEILRDGIAKLERLREVEAKQAKGDLKDIEETEDRYLKLKSDMRTTIRANPDWTAQQKQDYIDTITDEMSEDVARNWLKLFYIFGPITGSAVNYLFKKPDKPKYTKTATNPQTGERLGWNGKKWEPLQ